MRHGLTTLSVDHLSGECPSITLVQKLLGRLVLIALVVFGLWYVIGHYPGGTKFGCQAAGSVAHAASGDCPTSIGAADNDAEWAAGRLASIKDDRPTTGLFYEADRHETRYTSEQDSDSDSAWRTGQQDARRADSAVVMLGDRAQDAPTRSDAGRMVAESRRPTRVDDLHRRALMTTLTAGHLRRSDLVHAADHKLVPSDTFEAKDTIGGGYPVTPTGLSSLLDSLIHSPAKTAPVHLYLIPVGHRIELPEFPPSNLHFDLDPDHGVGAASLVTWDKDDEVRQWMTVGDAGRGDVLLTQDASNADLKRFPPESFITIPQLRQVLIEWAFGDLLPPAAVRWRQTTEREVGWF